MVHLRPCQAPLRKETVFSAAHAFLKLYMYAGAEGPALWDFSSICSL